MKELKRKKEIAKKEEEMLNELVKIVFQGYLKLSKEILFLFQTLKLFG